MRSLRRWSARPRSAIRLGDQRNEAPNFEELRATILAVAQKGVDYVRFKGLGEMDADELRDTTMDPASRTLVQVTMEDAASADQVFSMLMGDQVEPAVRSSKRTPASSPTWTCNDVCN